MKDTFCDAKKLTEILNMSESFSKISDLDFLLEEILFLARTFTNSDAGTIYLVDGDKLRFGYVQNDSLFHDGSNRKFIYSNSLIDINPKSIAGYVAATGNILKIADAYALDDSVPYTFNKKFDAESNYRTKSILAVPLRTNNMIIGVLQLINAREEAGDTVPFSDDDKKFVNLFGVQAASALKEAQMTRSSILRLVKVSELRDPKETGNHVNRVASYSVEIYKQYAQDAGLNEESTKKYCDILRLAAMNHDIGKVGIEDAILKKPAKLTPEEYSTMKQHTILGARLFAGYESPWDMMASEIALNHHEKYNGTGYPGKIDFVHGKISDLGEGKTGEEIPLSARIVALADVYDALISSRVYKGAWPEEKVLDTIKEERGKHFDPNVVDAFIKAYDLINAVRERYSEI